MMLTESLSFTDKALTTIALAIVVASLGVIMWGHNRPVTVQQMRELAVLEEMTGKSITIGG